MQQVMPPPPSAESPELLKSISFKPGVGQNIALHAAPTARNSSFLMSVFSESCSFFFLLFFLSSNRKDAYHEQ